MATDIVVPVLGESITEATIARWLKKAGDRVQVDEPVVELETEKATVELGAPKAGVLSEVLADEGEDVEVGAVIGRVDDAAGEVASEPSGEAASEPSGEAASEPSGEAASEPSGEAAPEPSGDAEPPDEAPQAEASAEAAPAPAEESAPSPGELDPSAIPRSGPGGTVTADDLRSVLDLPGGGDLSRSGPAARKWLADHGIDPSQVTASGPDGRITKGDVMAHLAEAKRGASSRSDADGARSRADAPQGGGAAAGAPRERRERMSRLRRTIASRLVEAQHTAAILTTFNEIDMGEVMALRKRHRDDFEERHGVRLGFTSFFAKAVVAALRQVPEVNAEIDGEEIVYHERYDLGMAVSAPQGLVVPVIRDCDTRSFAEIESALADLAERAREGKLKPDEMSGGTFTISNGGVFGSLLSTPILNRPQSGILGLHKIEDRPVARDGEVVIRPMMYVALSYDHRLIDGKGAVTFLVHVKQAIESPERLLLEL